MHLSGLAKLSVMTIVTSTTVPVTTVSVATVTVTVTLVLVAKPSTVSGHST